MKKFIPVKEVPNTKVIFETDLCKDVDDVGAIAFLCDGAQKKKFDLIGIGVNVNDEYEAPAADALLERFGMSGIPLCVWDGEILEGGTHSNYLGYLQEQLSAGRRALLEVQKPVEFYRSLLSEAEDGSVVIISVGFFCNLNVAYKAMPELFERKVRSVVVMAGSFGAKPGYKEFNIRKMPIHAHEFLSDYQGEIIYIPSEAGETVLTDLRCWPEECKGIVYESYRLFTKDKLYRPSWDLITVEFAVDGESEYYGLSPYGFAEVTPDSETFFKEDAAGRHAYVILKKTPEEVGAHISEELLRICR